MKKFETIIQRIFEPRYDGALQEFLIHYLHIEYHDGRKEIRLDKTFEGGIYRVGKPNERSRFSDEINWVDPEDRIEKRLIRIR